MTTPQEHAHSGPGDGGETLKPESVTTDVLNNELVLNEHVYSGDAGADLNSLISDLPAEGGHIHIAPRDDGSPYLLSTKVAVDKDNVRITGPSRDHMILAVDADVVAIEQQNAHTQIQNLGIKTTSDIRGSHTSDGLHMGGVSQVRDVAVYYMGRNGIAYTSAYQSNTWRASGIEARQNGQNVNTNAYEGNGVAIADPADLGYGSSTLAMSAANLRAGQYDGNLGHGIYNGFYSGHDFRPISMEGNSKYGLYNSGSDDCTFIGGWLESNTSGGALLDANTEGTRYYFSGPQQGSITDNGTSNSSL